MNTPCFLSCLLPDPRKRGEIQFVFAKSWSYHKRLAVVFTSMLAGLVIQLLLNFWLGLFVLFIGNCFSLIKGYRSKPVVKTGTEKWNQVTPDEFNKVILKQKQLKRWDLDAFDITNWLGVLTLILFGVFTLFMGVIAGSLANIEATGYVFMNAAAIFLPYWFSGTRSFLKKDRLIVKINLLQKMMVKLAAPTEIQVLPMLETPTTDEGGLAPSDARLMIRFLNAPETFLGAQIQISINSVQGKDYPYLYCVLIAKQGSPFFEKAGPSPIHRCCLKKQSQKMSMFW